MDHGRRPGQKTQIVANEFSFFIKVGCFLFPIVVDIVAYQAFFNKEDGPANGSFPQQVLLLPEFFSVEELTDQQLVFFRQRYELPDGLYE